MTRFLLVGLGFIASAVAEELSKKHEVTVTYRNLNPVKSKYIEMMRNRVNFVRAGLNEMGPLIEKAEVVVNFVGDVKGNEETLRLANVEVPKALAKMSVGKKFIHLSGATLGQLGTEIEEEEPHGNGLSPSTPFERTKLEGEREVLSVNPSAAIMRPTLVYGKLAAHVQFITIYKLVKIGLVPKLAINYMPISTTYISRAIEIMAESKPPRSYFYATECEPISVGELFSAFASGLGRKYRSFSIPTGLAKVFLPSEIRSLLRYSGVKFSCSTMRQLLGDLRFRKEELEENARFLSLLEKENRLIPT